MLKHLSQVEMLGLTASWVNEHRELFMSIPEIAALHPHVTTTHTSLLAALSTEGTKSPDLQGIAERAAEMDEVHDALVRAISGSVEADRLHCLASSPPDAERAALAQKVSSLLFPQGLAIVNASLLAASGNTERVAARLEHESDLQLYLESIPVREGTLMDLTMRWLETGRKLGELERARIAMVASQATPARESVRLNRLRAEWTQIVALVLSNLRISKAEPAVIATIRQPVLEASERAGRRYQTPRVAEDIPTFEVSPPTTTEPIDDGAEAASEPMG